MEIKIDYLKNSSCVVIHTNSPESPEWGLLKRIINDSIEDVRVKYDAIKFAWRHFLTVKKEVASFANTHSIKIYITNEASVFLQTANNSSYAAALKIKPFSIEETTERLQKIGFVRQLTDNQKNNLYKISCLPGGAMFSVPGAGKTTEALAYFFLNATYNDRLLVVAPKNAFSAWDEQLIACIPTVRDSFIRLRGSENTIRTLLSERPKFMLITYQKLPKVKQLIANELAHGDIFMFLDESHRIKSGKQAITADTILGLSYLPIRKLIMSGTPMPQNNTDLIPQFQYLYPEKNVSPDNVIELFQPIFVRTTKKQLNIPPVEHRLITVEMDELQSQLYKILKSEMRRQLNPCLSDDSKHALRKIGNCTIKIMQFVSNPTLLATDMSFAFDLRVGNVLLNSNSPKIEYACKKARALSVEGKKVIIWSSFVKNVELIAERLKDIGADYIHGGIDAGDENDTDTREGKIRRFHDDPAAMVLVANPSAASEGISLHKVCQYAIYVDRTFNAAHYLQSEDRIHRLGLSWDQKPIVEIVECRETIDQVIRNRLEDKVHKMSEALNDPSLVIEAIPYDSYEDDDIVDNIDSEDVKAILNFFFAGNAL